MMRWLTRRLPRRRARAVIPVVLGAVLLSSGCGFQGMYSVPLPGGADLGDHPYTVKAEFADVLNLVPQSTVKVHDVPVGKVDKITLEQDNSTALVTMTVNRDVQLPANASAAMRQSSLLGAKFVELLAPPAEKAKGSLKSGATIPLARTNRTPSVEEVLGALSLLLNGGGVEQIHDIAGELNDALVGNEPQIRSMLSNVDTLVTDLDSQRENIVRAIDGVNRLSGTLEGQKGKIAKALDEINPGLKVLNQQRDELVDMLKALDHLSGVTVDTVNKSKAELVHDLKALTPTLRKIAEAGGDVPKSLQILLTYPFSKYAMNDLRGDFFNANVHLNFDLSDIIDTMNRSPQPLIPTPSPHDQSTVPRDKQGTSPTPPGTRYGAPQMLKPAGTVDGLLGSLLGGS